ncbi:K(+)-transporting ATPase subunit F [Nemorincola caseinilytica]|uniref:K(+)-transporting ATPase subunit F n=1 Tax=Nemorincola caseinilytica TaxID=2054315 RepID=A0ABP8NEA8_9BACT
MSIITIILLVIAAILALVLILGVVSPKSYRLSRSVLIDTSEAHVFIYLKHLRNHDSFNVWAMKDPNMKRTYRGIDGTVGFVYAWDGNKQAGAGEQEIKALEEGKRIDIEVRFIRPFAAVAQTPLTLEAVSPTQTKVTWHMASSMKYPMNMMLLFMNMDKLLGADMEISLGKLKDILEAR